MNRLHFFRVAMFVLVSFVWFAATAMVSAATTDADSQTEQPPSPAAKTASQAEKPQATSDIDRFLVNQMHYSDEQIAQFKETVADMPPDQMKALLLQIKRGRQASDQWRQMRMEANRRSVANLESTASIGAVHASSPAMFNYSASYSAPVQRRTYQTPFQSHFRGYVLWLRAY